MPTRSPPYTPVFTHHFTCVNCISKILSVKNSPSSFPKSKILIRLFEGSKTPHLKIQLKQREIDKKTMAIKHPISECPQSVVDE
ncbi:hypothetical protein BK786_24170 [Bacillus thuringiensis serovar thailandensis]|nr:hypothetical protein BK786_24170 [Bacillus thuringiensis serovar thailandensis]